MNEAFVGQAKVIAQYQHCLSDIHPAEKCPELGQPSHTNVDCP